MAQNILEVKNVTKAYDSTYGVKNINFTLKKGQVLGFLGKNGAGKTTTIKLIMNLLNKDKGKINIFGKDHSLYEKKLKQKIGFVYDQLYYHSNETASIARKTVKRFYNNWNDESFDYYMKKFELPYNKKIKELSQGMKMKLGLTLALSHNAELFIMDEPTSGLDPVVRDELLQILKEIIVKNKNKSLFFSSHITEDVKKIADRLLIIHDGKVVENCSKNMLLNNYYLVKGDKTLLNKNNNHLFINIEETEGIFKGLTKNIDKVTSYLDKDKLKIKKANFDEILLNIIKGE